MCGFTGIISKEKICRTKFLAAHDKLDHRGQDDEGFITLEKSGNYLQLKGNKTSKELQNLPDILKTEPHNILFGHHRLSIIDLSANGHQPMIDGDFALIYNGILYNYEELREELISKGVTFKSQTDTEVILKSFKFWGRSCFPKFDGMWSVAIFDKSNNELTLGRDPFGIKPLYYATVGNKFIFASEIKFIHSFIEKPNLDIDTAYDYLRYSHLDHTERTFIQGVKSLPASSILQFRKGEIEIDKYSNQPPQAPQRNFLKYSRIQSKNNSNLMYLLVL